jgi:ABC-type anion transport system duplicated permease subunit
MPAQAVAVIWSWARVFLAAALTYLLSGLVAGTPLAWQAVLIAGVMALLPVVINWLNAADTRYGKGYVEPGT